MSEHDKPLIKHDALLSEPADPVLCGRRRSWRFCCRHSCAGYLRWTATILSTICRSRNCAVCTLLQSGPRALSNLSQDLYISVSAMTQIADRLERAGMVERVSGAEDRRVRLLQLSPLGVERMQSRRAFRTHRAEEALLQLSEEERRGVLEAVTRLLEAATATAPPTQQEDAIPIRQQQ